MHAPPPAKIPRPRSFTTRHRASLDDSSPAYYMVAELVFEPAADMAAGMGSAEGVAAVADRLNFDGGEVTMLHCVDANRL
jgi:uncharacterized protein (TIGR02118 family)